MRRGGIQLLLTGAGVLLAKLVIAMLDSPPGMVMLVLTLALGLSAIIGAARILYGVHRLRADP